MEKFLCDRCHEERSGPPITVCEDGGDHPGWELCVPCNVGLTEWQTDNVLELN